MDPSSFLDSLSTDAVSLLGTATVFGQGAIASSISGNPLYSNDPSAAAYATGGLAAGGGGVSGGVRTSGNANFLILFIIGYVFYRFAK